MTEAALSNLILASRSAARRSILAGAGVPFSALDAGVDEDAVKQALSQASPEVLAVELSCAKALAVSLRVPDAWVLGADQTLAFAGESVSKARSLDEARERLRQMRGQSHQLHSGVALAHEGRIVWSGCDTATLTMRDFSDGFLDTYLAAEGSEILACVGSYRLEGLGSQLFETIQGDYFTVLGLPLWSVLDQLRHAGVIGT